MRVLLDTHAFIWALTEPDKLSVPARRCLEDARTQVSVSAATAWEMATKHRLGKLSGVDQILERFDLALRGLQAEPLPITHQHALASGSFDHPHRDPFDRMLAAQARIEELVLISRDPVFATLDVNCLW